MMEFEKLMGTAAGEEPNNVSMEGIMPEIKPGDFRYLTMEFFLDAVAGWIKRQRSTRGIHNDLERCSPEDVAEIAKDLRLPASDFRSVVAKGPDAANDVSKMLCALSLKPAVLTDGDPATMRDLQRTCILCGQKRRCGQELAEGTAARNFHEFCPNAYTLVALLKQNEQPPLEVSGPDNPDIYKDCDPDKSAKSMSH